MMRMVIFIAAVSVLMSQAASGDEVRHTSFAGTLLGTWAQSAALCDGKDKSTVVISATKYSNADGTCSVDWIVETAGSLGPNYAVHASCADTSQAGKTLAANLIMRSQGNDRLSMGKSFEDLKIYQRCPAR
jgi:hypothetical protein